MEEFSKCFGLSHMWLIPFGKPKSNGYQPQISQDYKQDDQLNLLAS